MVTEGELRSHLDDTEKVRELQDKMAEMKAEVRLHESVVKIVNKMNILSLALHCCLSLLSPLLYTTSTCSYC